MSTEDIPLPFGYTSTSQLQGQVTQVGVKSGIAVKKVTFPVGTDSESLAMDSLYLVVVPNEETLRTVPLDLALTLAGVRSVNYFGYIYTTPDATDEKAHKGDPILTVAFPGQFFVSAKARAEDALHGNAIAQFEADNDITMTSTDGTTGTAMLTPNTLYFIVVNESSPATFTARVPVVCGDSWRHSSGVDGIVGNEDDEQCDDGDTESGDGCSATCQVEDGFSCSQGPQTTCVPYSCVDSDGGVDYAVSGTKTETVNADLMNYNDSCLVSTGVSSYSGVESCTGANCYVNEYACLAYGTFEPIVQCMGGCNAGVCMGAYYCGDGMILGNEECDDDNSVSGDGCSNSCEIEAGYTCEGSPSVCTGGGGSTCGNSSVDPGEQCDDGNIANGDGCSSTCEYETLGGICGDGTIVSPEECDDANTASGDGCSSACNVESGYQCMGTPSVCSIIPDCGNMIVEYPEMCDDGNTINTDTCTGICQLPACGDGYTQTQNDEQCDDGNDYEGDDCRNDCQLGYPIPNM